MSSNYTFAFHWVNEAPGLDIMLRRTNNRLVEQALSFPLTLSSSLLILIITIFFPHIFVFFSIFLKVVLEKFSTDNM